MNQMRSDIGLQLLGNEDLEFSKIGVQNLSVRARVIRNLKSYKLNACITKEERINLELDMQRSFDQLINNDIFKGSYVSFTPGNDN